MDPRPHLRPDPESGYTVIEVMFALAILLLGVLGVFSLVTESLVSTTRTTAREQGTNLARGLVERSRQVAFAQTAMADAPGMLRATLPASDGATALTGPRTSTFDVTRRNITYTVTVFACSIDDPSDGAGVGDATFCGQTDGTLPPGPIGTPAAAVNVLGKAVTLAAGGSYLTTVCNAVGTDNALLTQVSAGAGAVAPVSLCTAGSLGIGGSIAFDADPVDLRRVLVDVTWTRDGPGRVRQTTLLPAS